MGNSSRAGFTIIETVLFLGVSGLLILAMITGTGASINIQRYRDATESFKALVQDQYADIGNVQNGRIADQTCDATAKPSSQNNGEGRGQSECVIVGKYLRIDGGTYDIYTVLAYETNAAVAIGDSDVAVMNKKYLFNTSDTSDTSGSLEWGTRIAWPLPGKAGAEVVGTSNPRTLGILFLRSPHSGQIYTFTSNTIPAKNAIGNGTFTPMITSANNVPGRAARVVCIDSDGMFVDSNQSLYISANANGPNGVELRTNEIIKQKGGATEC